MIDRIGPNRDLLFEQLATLRQRWCAGVAVVFIDLEQFKAVNVTLEGEQVEVAATVGVTYVEPGDLSSADVVLARADTHMYEAKRRRYVDDSRSATVTQG